MMNRPTNFSWVIENKLAGCGLPVTEDEFKWAVDQGIKAIISVREVELPTDWFDGSDVEYLHLNVEDFGAPDMDQLRQAIDFIDQQISNSRPVMVHCAAGLGRTGTVLAAYLVKKQHLTAVQAIEKLRRIRPGSVQSVTQETALSVYEKHLKSRRD